MANQCQNETVCKYCAKKHESRNCPKVMGDDVELQCANCKGEHPSFHKECTIYQEHRRRADFALQNQERFHRVPTRVASNPPSSSARMSQSGSGDWPTIPSSQPSQQASQTPSEMAIFTGNTGNSGAAQGATLKRRLLGTKPKDGERAVNRERAVVLRQGEDSGEEGGLAGKAKTPVTIKSQRTQQRAPSRSTRSTSRSQWSALSSVPPLSSAPLSTRSDGGNRPVRPRRSTVATPATYKDPATSEANDWDEIS
jgi:hypothetical protein